MTYTEFEWQCRDGTNIFACEWKSISTETSVQGVVGIVHGMGEHSGRFQHVAEMLTSAGFIVLAFDQRGHGRTMGKRGHTPSYEALLESVDLLVAEINRRYQNLPRFLYGHSMGGNLTLNYLLRYKPAITGAIASGPWLKLAFDPPRIPMLMGRMVEKIYPTFTNKRPLHPEHLTSDPEMAKIYTIDPLGHSEITARFFFGVQKAGLWALEHAKELSVPLLLMHGGDDKVTSIHASQQFAERAGKLCKFVEWPGFQHELHNERDRSAVFDLMLHWLKQYSGDMYI